MTTLPGNPFWDRLPHVTSEVAGIVAQGENIVGAVYQMLNEKQRPHPRSLYHYTHAAGARDILESRQIWATDPRYLNDSSELAIADRLIEARLDECRQSRGSDADTFALDLVTELMDRGVLEEQNAYVACFCAHGDVLSQWRGYGDAGPPYALAFDLEGLGTALRVPSRGKRAVQYKALTAVLYDPSEQRAAVDAVVDGLLHLLRSAHRADAQATAQDRAVLQQICSDTLSVLRLFCKHTSFEEEQEWRLAFIDNRSVLPAQFRLTDHGFASYVSFSLAATETDPHPTFPVTSVKQGPTRSPDLAERGMKRLLAHLNHDATVTRTSSTLR